MCIFRLVPIQLLLLLNTTGAFQTPRCDVDILSSIRLNSPTALLAERKPSSVTHQRGAARNSNRIRNEAKSQTSHKLSSISIADVGSYDLHDFIQESNRWEPTLDTASLEPISKPQQKKITEIKGVSQEAKRSHILFVGNLSYDITSNEVSHLFNRFGKVESVSVPLNKRKKGHSRGFAFVTMSTQSEQDEAISKLHGSHLNGRRIRVSKAATESQKEILDNVKLTKIYVGNVPQFMTTNDLSQLFEKYGNVKDVILPTDQQTGKIKGYAFIMMNERDSEVAIRKIDGYTCYGRSLTVRKASRKTRITFWVGGLSYWTPVDEIKKLFAKFGSNVQCRAPGNFSFCRGSVLVTMDKADAYHAMRQVHGTLIDDHVARIDKYIPPNERRHSGIRLHGGNTVNDNAVAARNGGINERASFMPTAFKVWAKYLKTSIYKNIR